MGQRTQAFIAINNQDKKQETFGFHSQWKYGYLFLTRLSGMIDFSARVDEKHFEYHYRGEETLLGVLNFYNLSVDEGLHSYFSVTNNPRHQDNNNGQFFIDYNLKKIGILGGPEDTDDNSCYSDNPKLLTAKEYLELTYPNEVDTRFINKFNKNMVKHGFTYFDDFQDMAHFYNAED